MTSSLVMAGRALELPPGQPLLMGVVNASPESFSDGAQVGDLEAQVARAEGLVADGASILDIGGESGVTDKPAVAAQEEIERVCPLIERVSAMGVTVSVDTWKPEVARAAIGAGASLVNDVSALLDPGLADVCAQTGAGLVITHTRAEPKRKEFPSYEDVTADVLELLGDRLALALERGVGEGSIVLDPGPDLAKTPAQTIDVLSHLDQVVALGHPVLLAVSRKDFVGALTQRRPADRLSGTLAAVGEGVDAGAAILRVHDVAQVSDFLRVRAALRGQAGVPPDLALDPSLRRQRAAE
ncbi:MAG: dihydropteroate synthase [Thermoleophilaceae bacterium]|nr:dihydropteroate synthase [Thermoleophilaceae bacterium]